MGQSLATDGLPVFDDWIVVLEGLLFAGINVRDPVDVTVLISI